MSPIKNSKDSLKAHKIYVKVRFYLLDQFLIENFFPPNLDLLLTNLLLLLLSLVKKNFF